MTPDQTMKESEIHLGSKVYRINQSATHDRPLRGSYSYEEILGVDLVQVGMDILHRKGGPVRVLDIGCGSGLALRQFEEAVDALGSRESFEFYGMGLNWYHRMHIPPSHFIMGGLYHSHCEDEPFDLVMSVFTFHYVWHKLEGIERIHNDFLADEGIALIHFPGFLASLPGSSKAACLDEVSGNEAFSRFLTELDARGDGPKLEYSIVSYCSGDDDGYLLDEFERLRFRREPDTRLDFGLTLESFGVVPVEFCYEHPSISHPEYVLSRYAPKPTEPSACESEARLDAMRLRYSRIRLESSDVSTADLHMTLHPLPSDTIVALFPGAGEDHDNAILPFQQIASNLQESGFSASVYCDNPLVAMPKEERTGWLRSRFRQMTTYILENAIHVCGVGDPDLAMMGYSAGASAIAAFASEFPAVDRILLVAPSLDVEWDVIEHGLRAFRGEVYIVIGDDDDVVSPCQARRFYEAACGARTRRLVEVSWCDHAFSGQYNQTLMRHAPLWAFGGDPEFPPAVLSSD
ncbi:MAG: class I SAM-dependent methyltransferase [Planctomycetes bacterium]|nr:class I SAM-dependent methyltransferase [Planctomycetota bacterium]